MICSYLFINSLPLSSLASLQLMGTVHTFIVNLKRRFKICGCSQLRSMHGVSNACIKDYKVSSIKFLDGLPMSSSLTRLLSPSSRSTSQALLKARYAFPSYQYAPRYRVFDHFMYDTIPHQMRSSSTRQRHF